MMTSWPGKDIILASFLSSVEAVGRARALQAYPPAPNFAVILTFFEIFAGQQGNSMSLHQ